MQNKLSKVIRNLNNDYTNALSEVNYNIFKNDQLYGQRLKELKEYKREITENSIGLIVGPGAVLSSFPELPCQTIIICDYNDFVIEATKHIQSIFERSEFVTEYITNLYSDENLFFKQLVKKYGMQTFQEFRDTQIDALEDQHVEYSQLRFFRCKQAYQSKKLHFLKIDFNDKKRINQVNEQFNKLDLTITFADISNIHQYTELDKYFESLKLLPFSKDVLIFHSQALAGQMLKTQPICEDLDMYMKKLKKAL